MILAHGKLWGISGDELEYVSQRIVTRFRDPNDYRTAYLAVIMRFTDHDVHATGPHDELIEGMYYEIEFPIYDGTL